MKLNQLAVVAMTIVAASSHTAKAVISVPLKSCTKTVVVQVTDLDCVEFAKANSCTKDELLTWNVKLGPECENNNHLDKGTALCVSVSANTAAAIAIANNDDPSSTPSLGLSSPQAIINSSGGPSLLATPLSVESAGASVSTPPAPATPLVQQQQQTIPSSPKSGTVVVVHDNSAPISYRTTTHALTVIAGVIATTALLLL